MLEWTVGALPFKAVPCELTVFCKDVILAILVVTLLDNSCKSLFKAAFSSIISKLFIINCTSALPLS